jgi:hypothetical protein
MVGPVFAAVVGVVEMNPYLIIVAGIFWVLSVGGAYIKGQIVGKDRVVAQQASEDQIRRETREAAQQGAAAAIAALKPVNTTIVQKVQHEIRTDRIYSDCRVPADGVQLANQAITGRTEPAGGDKLPSAVAPK